MEHHEGDPSGYEEHEGYEEYEGHEEHYGEHAEGEEYEHEGEYAHDGEYGEGEGHEEEGHGDSPDGREEYGDDQEHQGEYNEGETPSELEAAFEANYRKIQRDLLDNLNKVRTEKGLQKLSTDLISLMIADDYARFLKESDTEPDLNELSELYHNYGDLNVIYTKSKFEEDTNVLLAFYQEFINLGYLFFEVESDRKVVLSSEFNHVGIGIAMTEDTLILVQVFSKKMLTISKINDGEDGGIEVRGKMLNKDVGLYAVRLMDFNSKKEIHLIDPEKIEFDKISMNFIAFIDVNETASSPGKMIEFYVRNNPDTIEYKKPQPGKIRIKDVTLVLRAPCVIYPDPRYLQEDDEDRARREREAMEKFRIEDEKRKAKDEESRNRKETRKLLRQEIEERKLRGEEIESLASSTQRSDRTYMSKNTNKNQLEQKAQEQKDLDRSQDHASDMSPNKTEDKGEDHERVIDPDSKLGKSGVEAIKEPVVSNKEIREELERAIYDAEKQLNRVNDQNEYLQLKILELRKNENYVETKQDVPMTEAKYLNTLAHVHQIRLDLKQTQERYNRMAAELQMKLEEKQAKCYDIKKAFMDLKREVCKKAAYSRTDKPIPEKKIDEWEQREEQKSNDLQALRLENLRLRNQLAKGQKIYKKKEELAEGLHMIDFEQLKIENQTLNEKIEERNEDLHKLKKKNTNTVQILTHYKEKLQWVISQNQKLEEEGKKREEELTKKRNDLNKFKEKKKEYQTEIQNLSQQTGIVNNDDLNEDFDSITKNSKTFKEQIAYLEKKHQFMKSIIEQYEKKVATKNLGPGNSNRNAYQHSLTGSQVSMRHN